MTDITLTREGSGYVLTCACHWTRWAITRPDSDKQREEHVKKCKGGAE